MTDPTERATPDHIRTLRAAGYQGIADHLAHLDAALGDYQRQVADLGRNGVELAADVRRLTAERDALNDTLTIVRAERSGAIVLAEQNARDLTDARAALLIACQQRDDEHRAHLDVVAELSRRDALLTEARAERDTARAALRDAATALQDIGALTPADTAAGTTARAAAAIARRALGEDD